MSDNPQQTRENVTSDLPSLILDALQNPSSKHAVIYAALAFALLIGAVGLSKLLAGKNANIAVRLDDIAGEETKEDGSKSVKNDRIKVEKESKSAEVLPTGESIDLDDLHRQLDQAGPFT